MMTEGEGSMIIDAPAKINWFLDVVGKRPQDGYHLLQMVMQQISLMDKVSLQKSEKDILTSSVEDLPTNESNLALKAWLLLKKRFNLQECLAIHIEKNIPLSSGLGGGSTDAAAVLKGANQMLDLGLEHKELAELALQLGSDVPFFLLEGAALAEGIGEILTPLPALEKQYLLLVNPGFPVSTAEVYEDFSLEHISRKPQTPEIIEALMLGQPTQIGPLLVNVLETVTANKYPEINKIKFEMAACGLYPLMAGSGASVFGLAVDQESAQAAQEKFTQRWPFVEVFHTL
jgi:4-diphosphocytidyl-2-C-methyl-D-erythritol kinase